MNWIEVTDENNLNLLPPIGEIVWIIYLSDYDDGPVVQLGGRDFLASPEEGWNWGVLDGNCFAKNWEPKLYGLEFDDDYRVTHWAKLEWPEVTPQMIARTKRER